MTSLLLQLFRPNHRLADQVTGLTIRIAHLEEQKVYSQDITSQLHRRRPSMTASGFEGPPSISPISLGSETGSAQQTSAKAASSLNAILAEVRKGNIDLFATTGMTPAG